MLSVTQSSKFQPVGSTANATRLFSLVATCNEHFSLIRNTNVLATKSEKDRVQLVSRFFS